MALTGSLKPPLLLVSPVAALPCRASDLSSGTSGTQGEIKELLAVFQCITVTAIRARYSDMVEW